MVGHGGCNAGSYLADLTSPIPSHCAVMIPFKKCPSALIVVTSTFLGTHTTAFATYISSCNIGPTTLLTTQKLVYNSII